MELGGGRYSKAWSVSFRLECDDKFLLALTSMPYQTKKKHLIRKKLRTRSQTIGVDDTVPTPRNVILVATERADNADSRLLIVLPTHFRNAEAFLSGHHFRDAITSMTLYPLRFSPLGCNTANVRLGLGQNFLLSPIHSIQPIRQISNKTLRPFKLILPKMRFPTEELDRKRYFQCHDMLK